MNGTIDRKYWRVLGAFTKFDVKEEMCLSLLIETVATVFATATPFWYDIQARELSRGT
jgi:hypothetical protein